MTWGLILKTGFEETTRKPQHQENLENYYRVIAKALFPHPSNGTMDVTVCMPTKRQYLVSKAALAIVSF